MQAARALLLAGECEFAIHDVHDVSLVCPSATPYLPAPQAMQKVLVFVLPTLSLYVPATHAVQFTFVSLALPENPAMHWQSAIASLPASEVEFAAHAVQSPFHPADLYVPATHNVQFPVPASPP